MLQIKFYRKLRAIGLLVFGLICLPGIAQEDGEVINIKPIGHADGDDSSTVPFAIIEQVPVYPGCEYAGSNSAKKKCMSNKINAHVNRKFNIAADTLLSTGRYRISVNFKIDTKGQIVDVNARAPSELLEAEAIRVVQLLPQMSPGIQKGNPVKVSYSLPILFQLEE